MSKKKTATINVVVFGPAAVGKTALIYQYVTNTFIECYDPTIDEEKTTTKVIDDVICTINIQDTCGTDQFQTMREMYIRRGEGFLLVFSANNIGTLAELETYYDVIAQFTNEKRQNHCSSNEQIRFRTPTSAKTNENVSEAFQMVIRQIIPKKTKKSGACFIL
ncbi:Uncharacterized protein QTN25_005066 [Entamoeba marina]